MSLLPMTIERVKENIESSGSTGEFAIRRMNDLRPIPCCPREQQASHFISTHLVPISSRSCYFSQQNEARSTFRVGELLVTRDREVE